MAGAKVSGLRFGESLGTVHDVVLRPGETRFEVLQTDADASNWAIRAFYGKISVNGNVVSCANCGYWVASSSGLGNPFTLVAGDNERITEIWRIL